MTTPDEAVLMVDGPTAEPARTARIERFFVEHRVTLIRTAMLVRPDRQFAEDVVSEVFDSLLSSGRPLPANPPAYLRVAVLNRARTRLRGKRGEVPLDTIDRASSVGLPGRDLFARLQGEAVVEAVRRLPQRQLSVVVCRYWERLTIEETADLLGISAGSVKTHSHRAIKAIERTLRSVGYDETD